MELRVLRYFLAVASAGSMTLGAAALHVTQPTLTRQIHELEDELGCKLFERKSRSLILTTEGLALRKYAQQISELAEKAETELRLGANAVSGCIYIGAGETKAIRGIADVICELRGEHPGIQMHLMSGNAQDVIERLDRNLLDFGVILSPADISKYDHLDLSTGDIWGVIARKDSPLAKLDAVRREDLQGVPLLLSRQAMARTVERNDFRDWFGDEVDSLDVVATFNLVYNAVILVAAGLGYAVTIDGLADTGESSQVCFRPLEPPLTSCLSMIWKRQTDFSRPARLFLERMRSHADVPTAIQPVDIP